MGIYIMRVKINNHTCQVIEPLANERWLVYNADTGVFMEITQDGLMELLGSHKAGGGENGCPSIGKQDPGAWAVKP